MKEKNLWRNIGGKNFCSFKLQAKNETFCKNLNNVTGLCNENSCPLANSSYATVREINDALFLYIKEPERVNKPLIAYEKIKLSEDYQTAANEIEKELEFFDLDIIERCKQRLSKLKIYVDRKKRMLKDKILVKNIHRKQKKKELLGASKALNKVKIEKNIKDELYERLTVGMYGKNLKEKFSKKEKIYEFEESDEDFKPIAAKKKTKKNMKW